MHGHTYIKHEINLRALFNEHFFKCTGSQNPVLWSSTPLIKPCTDWSTPAVEYSANGGMWVCSDG